MPNVECVMLNAADVYVGWDVLFLAVQQSGLYDDMQIASMLTDAMQGKTQVWIVKARTDDGQPDLKGVLVTKIYKLPYQHVKTLSLIHGNAVAGHIDDVQWQRVYKTLIRYAQSEKCTRFEVFSDNPRVREILTAFGFRQAGLFVKEV